MDQREVTMLGRRIGWKVYVLTYEAEPDCVEIVEREMGLARGSNGLQNPAVKETAEEVGEDGIKPAVER